MYFTLNRILAQYGLAIGFALLVFPIGYLSMLLFIDSGWHFLTVSFIAIFLLQVLYYYLTTYLNAGRSIFSFVLNFILWVTEQVQIEHALGDTCIYQDYKVGAVILGASFWATNKILIDVLFSMNKKVALKRSRIDALIIKNK